MKSFRSFEEFAEAKRLKNDPVLRKKYIQKLEYESDRGIKILLSAVCFYIIASIFVSIFFRG